MSRVALPCALTVALLAICGSACAVDGSADAAQANNPLANFTAVNLHW